MKPSLNLRLSQHLALTPQLQQSIRLLQLSTLELEQEIEQALAENPLLERENEWLDSPLRVAADGAVHLSSAPEAAAAGHGDDQHDDRDARDEAGDWNLSDFSHAPAGDRDAEHSPYQLQEAMLSLREHLLLQAQLLSLSPRDRGLLHCLIETLDDNGYLPAATFEELAADLPAELEIEPDEILTALKLLQSLEPAGIGARSPAECLGLQLLRLPASEIRDVALRLVANHLELLAARDFKRLKRALQTDEDTLKAAAQLIRALNPHPGQAFGGPQADYVIPDVIVRKGASGWIVELNPAVMPRLRVNDMYAQILKRNRDSDAGLQQKLQEARWMIRNIQQRFDTILRVAQAIVERQKNFFTDGEIAMRPLVLREIADTLGLHESTISRVTTSKYMATPLGTFELKYFFGSHVATEAGGAASSTAIRALIKQLVGAENSQRPLSDSKIADMLAEQGFVVARRTVAKYREALKIPAVNLRKTL